MGVVRRHTKTNRTTCAKLSTTGNRIGAKGICFLNPQTRIYRFIGVLDGSPVGIHCQRLRGWDA